MPRHSRVPRRGDRPYPGRELVALPALMLGVLASGAPHLAADLHEGHALATCRAAAPVSRWVENADRYVASERYGRDPQWLATVAGVAAAAGKVFVFDEGKPAVLELSPTLSFVREFGRSGEGPGEISAGVYLPFVEPYGDRDFLGFDGEAVAIYDRREIEVFAVDGSFRRQVRVPGGFGPFQFGVRFVKPDGPDRVLFANDSVDLMGNRPRRLQVWSVDGHGREEVRRLLWQIPLPWQKKPGGPQTLARDARPFWASQGGCHVASDGASPYLFRWDAAHVRYDSLPLPAWPVPAFGKHEDDRFRPSFAKDPESAPLALMRWMDLTIDPDGWVWVRAWTGMQSGEVKVFAVSMATGQTLVIEPPAFPRAFGDPGVFYAVAKDQKTDEQMVVRYVRGGE